MAEPFFWNQTEAWYVWTKVDGKRKRVFLHKDKKKAFAKWKAGLLAKQSTDSDDPLFRVVAAKWVEHQTIRHKRGDVSDDWFRRVVRTLKHFVDRHETIRCSKVTADVVLKWIGPNAATSYESTKASLIKQVLNFGVRYGMIAKSPLAAMTTEVGNRREGMVTLAEHRAAMALIDGPKYRFFYWVLYYTGCRPSEVRTMRWEYLNEDCSRATLTKHKNAKKTKRPRILYFNRNVAAVLRRHRKYTGFVFTVGGWRPFSIGNVAKVLRRAVEKTDGQFTCYTYRHAFITRMMERGVSVADIAEITGTSLQMISKHYGHLDKSKDRLQGIVDRVTR